MDGRERVRRMFERGEQDRTPRHESFWPETIRRWEVEGLVGGQAEVLRLLGGDFHSLCWCWPAPFPGRRTVVEEDAATQVVRDEWGGLCRFWKGKSGTPEHLGFGCDSRETWASEYREALRNSVPAVEPGEAARAFAEGRRLGRWTHLTTVEGFEALRKLIGDEVFLMGLIEDPEWIVDIVRVHTDAVLRTFEAVLAKGVEPDGLWIYGDMAFNHATFCSPDMYRELIWPFHKQMADWAHERGMKVIFHTDGRIGAVLDLYIEAGFDCLQPIEAKAGMDIREIAPVYGDRLALFGNIDIMVLATNRLDLIEEEIRAKFAAGMATRGYAYHSDHSVPPQVSWETYQAIIGVVERYGRY